MIKLENISHTAVHTDEWHRERLGRITASPFYRLISDKKDWTDGALTYIYEKAGEVITGERADEEFFNNDVDWGNANEADAIKWSAKNIGLSILRDTVSGGSHRFIRNGEYSGCTPDALLVKDMSNLFSVDGEKLKAVTLETKCPRKHARFIALAKCNSPQKLKMVSKQYYWQVIKQMLDCNCNGYFSVYSPKFKCGNIIFFDRQDGDIITDIAKAKFITEKAEHEIINTVIYLKNKQNEYSEITD